ncbi:MAG: FAD-dependent oxidoreductase [Slackia sp.]|nr:FAD-dependent oxidoreductase [Slackia sp.]
MKAINRRSFCAGAAILGGSFALAGCSGANSKQPGEEKTKGEVIEADIAVIGSGLAGEACALAAAQNGANVVLVEKSPTLGISFQTSKGNVSIYQGVENEEFWQFVSETTDTMNDFIARFKKATETGKIDAPYPDYDRVKALMQASCETVDWVEKTGIDFIQSFTKEKVGTDTVWPDTSADDSKAAGQLITEKMTSALEEAGVEILLEHEATELMTENGKVVGVVLESKGKTKTIAAEATVLACGGFGGSADYLNEFVPSVGKIGFQYLGNAMNTGDGITMGKAVGAALYDNCWVIPFNIMPSKKLTDADAAFATLVDMSLSTKPLEGGGVAGKMIVDAQGRRFVNEAGPGILLASSMADHDAAPYYVLFDSSNAEACEILEKGISTGDIIKADTIEDLASASGAAALVDTFAAYQAFAGGSAGDECGKPAEKAVAYGEGPYYLVSYVPSYVTTMGGLKTDGNCRVIDEAGNIIDGLWAIGELTHRFMYNRSFVRHCSNSVGLSMGRLTGEAIAKDLA